MLAARGWLLTSSEGADRGLGSWQETHGVVNVYIMADSSARRRVSVKEAARLLATSEHAIRQRLYRGSLEAEKDERGNVTVLVPEHLVESHGEVHSDTQREEQREAQAESAMPALIEELRDKNRILEEQLREANESNRENRRLLAALTQRIPELEPPQDTASERRGSPEPPSEEPYSTHAPPVSETPVPDVQHKRSWWRAFFGLE